MRAYVPLLLLPLTALFIGVQGCGDYQKVLKSSDPEFKWEKAQEYFADDRCIQSLPLLQELIGLFRGTERMEDVYFMYAEAHLCIQDWFMGRYSMRNLPRRFPILTEPKKQSFAQHSAATGYLLDQSSIKARLPWPWTNCNCSWTATPQRT